MSCFVKSKNLLKVYNKVWDKISNIMQRTSELVYNEKYSKTKLKSCDGKITNVYNNGVPKESSHFVCFSGSLIDSKIVRNNCPLVFLEECKYVIKENNMIKFINCELEISSKVSNEK